MKKDDILYMHIYNPNDGVFQTLPAIVHMVDGTIIHTRSKVVNKNGNTMTKLGHILPSHFDTVLENELNNELIVYSKSEDTMPVKQVMMEYLIKQKNQETITYENKIRVLDNSITKLENIIELEAKREDLDR